MTSLREQIAREAASSPMGPGSRSKHNEKLTLLVDGDALAYSSAGNDDTPIGVARRNATDRIAAAKAQMGAGGVKILTTAQSSNKGFRFAVARSKPYQGHRTGAHRPKNWEALRRMLEEGAIPDVELTTTVEADDLFGLYATKLGPENVVIYTEDKDMRMVPGWHLSWSDHSTVFIPEGTWDKVHNGLQYGRKWFWLQMLQGDQADNIPGLPNLTPVGLRSGLVGPKTAQKLLSGITTNDEAVVKVGQLYHDYYGKETHETEMLEQAILLWMRSTSESPWDVLARGNPLDSNWWNGAHAVAEIKARIKDSL